MKRCKESTFLRPNTNHLCRSVKLTYPPMCLYLENTIKICFSEGVIKSKLPVCAEEASSFTSLRGKHLPNCIGQCLLSITINIRSTFSDCNWMCSLWEYPLFCISLKRTSWINEIRKLLFPFMSKVSHIINGASILLFKQAYMQWCAIKNHHDPIYVVNWHFSRHPDRC